MKASAEAFVATLKTHQSDDELAKIARYFKVGEGQYGHGDVFLGVKMGQVFALAKAFVAMAPEEIEKLIEHELHEVRAGGLSIMSRQAGNRKTPESRRKELFELYLRRHDRINNWDLVDLAAANVVGGYLRGKPRDALYRLAGSTNIWERRTAVYATMSFIRVGELDDLYAIAELPLADPEDLIHKATGGVLRFAGDRDPERLRAFLDKHAADMPRVMLRYALEHFEAGERKRYMGMKAGR